ncbi:MAG: hypothetical protein HY315_01050 [Acidobacteria bacterium]|nr:hypothetical protein [Acidobacteriota bacterium]
MKRFLTVGVTICWLVGLATLSAQTPEEYAALMKVLKEPAIDTRIKLGEELLQQSPKSAYVVNVRQQLIADYNSKGNYAKVVEHAEQLGATKDPVMLTVLAAAYGERKNDVRSLETAQSALEGLNSGAKPENVPDAQWATQKNNLTGVNQFLIGTALLHLGQKKSGEEKAGMLAKARQALMASVRVNPRNDRAYYQLGLTLSEMGEGADACDALAKAVVLNGPIKAVAQYDLENIYTHYNKSKVGLDKVLEKARAALK